MAGYIIKMNNLYGMKTSSAYWQSIGDGCFQFTEEIKNATIFESEEDANRIMAHSESYKEMYNAESMEIINLLLNPIPVCFKINGRDTSDEELIIRIPDKYKDWFEGVNFKDRDQLSRALMYAHCAEEGEFYNKPWISQRNEQSLKSLIKSTK